jgi:hypothetical protein
MFDGGSPAVTIGASWPAPGVAWRATPGTATGAADRLIGAGGCVDTRPMVTKTIRMNAARPNTIIAGRMEIPPGVAGRCGSGPALAAPSAPASVPVPVPVPVSVSVSWSVMTHQAYGGPDHPKWSSGPCPAPRRQSALPARARATNSLASAIASGGVAPPAR